MTGLLAIWAACAFWAVMIFDLDRDSDEESVIYYYGDGSLSTAVGVFAVIVILAPITYIGNLNAIHEDSQ